MYNSVHTPKAITRLRMLVNSPKSLAQASFRTSATSVLSSHLTLGPPKKTHTPNAVRLLTRSFHRRTDNDRNGSLSVQPRSVATATTQISPVVIPEGFRDRTRLAKPQSATKRFTRCSGSTRPLPEVVSLIHIWLST